MLATWHWHIEISSKCTLKCPRCARQEVPVGLVNTELKLDFFKKNFTPDFILSNVEKITFCGDDGDPIYAHDLIPVIRYIKSVKPVEFVIVTNGSYKTVDWWQELAECLTERDTVHFSIDGYDNNSNNIYRINSDYDSIMLGVDTLRKHSKCIMIWDVIAFNFNENHLHKIGGLAAKHGFDAVQLTKSTKFGAKYPSYGADDALQPSPDLISSTHRFERELINITGRNIYTTHPINFTLLKEAPKTNITPLCEIGNKGLFINSQGLMYPCCWVANRYNHNSEWQTLAKRFDLHTRTLTEVLADPFWNTEFQSFRWQECQTKCASIVVDQEYATSW